MLHFSVQQNIFMHESVEITNKMQPCNRIYIHTQPGQRMVTIWVYKPEAANRV